MTHGKKVHKKRRRLAQVFITDIRVQVLATDIPRIVVWEIYQKKTRGGDYLQIGAGGSGMRDLVKEIDIVLRSSMFGNPPVNNLMPWITSIDNEHKTEMGEE